MSGVLRSSAVKTQKTEGLGLRESVGVKSFTNVESMGADYQGQALKQLDRIA